MTVNTLRDLYTKMLMVSLHFIIGKISIKGSGYIQRKEKMLMIMLLKKIKMLKEMLPTDLINTIIFQLLML